MASSLLKHVLFLVAILTTSSMVQAGDSNILSDFIVDPLTYILGNGSVNGNFFTYTGLRGVIDGPTPSQFKATKASMHEFTALNGQSVSMTVLQFPNGTVNPPHTHPRSAELLFVIEGFLEVGFVDTTNKLYTQTLYVGDMFIFPKGLVHFQYNADSQNPAIAISAFGSANPGLVSVPITVFTTGIDVGVLAKSFKTDVATIQRIQAGLAVKA